MSSLLQKKNHNRPIITQNATEVTIGSIIGSVIDLLPRVNGHMEDMQSFEFPSRYTLERLLKTPSVQTSPMRLLKERFKN